MLISLLVATVLAILVVYANARLNPDATIKNVVHVAAIVVWVLYCLVVVTGRPFAGLAP
jgi:hypothetical protein